jgi:hypothetical protein
VIGPDSVGDEFDETAEDEKSDPNIVYAVLTDDEQDRSITITAADNATVTVKRNGDDVSLTVRGGHAFVVPRSALEEALRTAGIISS